MALDKNNNQAVVRQLAQRSVHTGGRTSLLTILTVALTAMLVTAMVLQTTGMVSSQKKSLERAQQVIYMNLTEKQRSEIESDERISSTITYKTGQGVKLHNILVQPSYYEPPTTYMNSSLLLCEGRVPEAMDEIAIDKATLRAFGLPEDLGVQLTIPFLNSVPETFTVVGLTDHEAGGDTLSLHLLYHSLAYAKQGPQLEGSPWCLMAQVKGGAKMNGPALKSLVYQLGEKHNVAYQNINPHNYYINLRTVNTTNVLICTAIAVALAIVSLIVICSIFYLSVAGRVRQFGQLRTIGMTAKQLRHMVNMESWLLCGIGTPVGFALASAFMLVVGPENGWTFINNLIALAASAVLCAAAVWLGVQKPASLAAKASPFEASRFQSGKGERERGAKARSLTLVGLAKLNFFQNVKQQLLTMLSLAVGGILFMTGIIYVNAWDLEAYSRQGEFHDSEYFLYFDYNTENSLENGTSAMQLQGLFGETFQTALRQLPDVENITAYDGVDVRFRWNNVEGSDSLTPIEREDAAGLQRCLQEGIGDYDALVESGGVYISSSGLWKEIYGKVPQIGEEIEISYYNGTKRTMRLPVVGIGGNDLRNIYIGSSMILIPRETANALFGDMDTTKRISVSMKDDSHTPAQDEEMRSFLTNYPQLQLDTLTKEMENDVVNYIMAKGLFLAIGGFVVLFSLVNLLNTLLSGLMSRRQQLAMLAALGMTRRQIRKTLTFENMLLAGVNLMATLTLGTLSGWGVCRLMAELGANYVKFSFPLSWFLLYTIVALGAPMLITQIGLKSFYKESLIERLRTAE